MAQHIGLTSRGLGVFPGDIPICQPQPGHLSLIPGFDGAKQRRVGQDTLQPGVAWLIRCANAIVEAVLTAVKPGPQRCGSVCHPSRPALCPVRGALVPNAKLQKLELCLVLDGLHQLCDLHYVVVPQIQHAIFRQHPLTLQQPRDHPVQIVVYLVPVMPQWLVVLYACQSDVIGRVGQHQVHAVVWDISQDFQAVAMPQIRHSLHPPQTMFFPSARFPAPQGRSTPQTLRRQIRRCADWAGSCHT